MAKCPYVYKSGKRKGEKCGKETTDGSGWCLRHGNSSTSVQYLETIDMLQFKLLALDTTPNNKMVIMKRFRYLESLPTSSTEYQKNLNWLRHALNFPYNRKISLPVCLGSGDVSPEVTNYIMKAYKKLDDYIYGLQTVKEELLTFICKRISNPEANDHVLALQGKNGTGKTRLAKGLAHALGLPIRVVNAGGLNDCSVLCGHAFTYVDSEPGRIVQIMNETQCKNCIIYFDELDKVHQTDKGQAIYSFLTHLIDPSQNTAYQDVYLSGLELDVSKVFFVFSFNDDSMIDTTVKDRLKIIKIADPSMEDKICIAQKFLVPEICKNISYNVSIDRAVVERIVRGVAGRSDTTSGLRSIKRILEDIVAKLNVLRMLDVTSQKKMSFYDVTDEKMIDRIVTGHLTSTSEEARGSMFS